MLKRKLYNDLLEWKNNDNNKALIVKGARQVGKTFIIREFGKNNYKHFVEINFVKNPNLMTIFDGDLDSDSILSQISLKMHISDLFDGDTLIFLDEIQECPNARTALKFMAEDKRYDTIASGSLLGIKYKEVISFPVGYTKQIEMFSLDFEEFLWANNISKKIISDLKDFFNNKKILPLAMHEEMLSLFKKYIVVGGMPSVVNDFITYGNYQRVLNIQRDIINDYKEDFIKYASNSDKPKIRACFESIPKHLAKDYKKFRYSLVDPNGSARKYEGSLMWLYDAGIINFCYNLSIPEFPYEGNSMSDSFKVYMKDTGLLIAMLDDGTQEEIMDGNLGIYKGAIYENIIADIFTKNKKKLYYYEKNNSVEIDFFIRYLNKVTAVEVKSATNKKSKSLKAIVDKYNYIKGIKLAPCNFGDDDIFDVIPIYLSIFI